MRLAVFKNRNRTQVSVATDYMLIIGASSQRGLTNQGMGTKLVGVQSYLKGLKFARASHDDEGPYIGWYETRPYKLGDKMSERVWLFIKRPGKDVEEHPMTVDAHAFEDAWADNAIGEDFQLVREPVLDAADEDGDFKIEYAREIEFAPPGWTYTYLEIPGGGTEEDGDRVNSVRMVLKHFDYFFRRVDDVVWLSDTVGYADLSSYNETRLYITAEGAPIAYVGYSNGVGKEPAFDWILRETKTRKWASMPKRTLEDYRKALDHIASAVRYSDDPNFLAQVFKSMCNKGWELELYTGGDYGWNYDVVRKAFDKITNGKPIHHSKDDLIMHMAMVQGEKLFVVPQKLYELGVKAGVLTASKIFAVREKGQTIYRPMTDAERMDFNKVIKLARQKFPDTDWNAGHVFMAIDSDSRGVHNPRHGGLDVIGVNCKLIREEFPDAYHAQILRTTAHELAHHLSGNTSDSDHWHDEVFADALRRVFIPDTLFD